MISETLNFDTANGATTAYVAKPENTDGAQPVIVIHEWWGLNDQIKKIADRYAGEGFVAIAPDLYRGKIADNPDDASAMMAALEISDGLDTIKNAIDIAREKFGFSHFGISGYCMGGTYALYAACEIEGISASAPYYGDIPPEDQLKDLNVPVVFISGTRDAWITPEKVGELESAADKYGLDVDSLKYDADHAFSNSARPEVYDRDAAEDAWAKVVGFFKDKL
ncbi:MAG: dienelactone hydrolase family protein [Pyrinomonadaceae bacterium]|nr:dienelactone hydrolase family protein [Pyrinomonadaceae bacterium]